MKCYYICTFTGNSGISKYAAAFYEGVLKPKGFIHIDSSENLTSVFTRISSRDHVHLEIGIFQEKEIEILLLMLKANYNHVSITLHDAPILKYPLNGFSNPFLNNISKFYDRFISGFKNSGKYIHKIKSIYVLTHKGLEASIKIYKSNNFFFLPHIVDQYPKSDPVNLPGNNFLYFGFIGKNKGIEYALALHAEIIRQYPEIQFYVVGTALGKKSDYLNYLKQKYTRNVHFCGYIPEEDLTALFHSARYAFLLFKDYKFFYPASGSILTCMDQGKIVFTNPVNAIPETIKDMDNGLFLSGKKKKDLQKITSLFSNKELQEKIINNATLYLKKEHIASQVEKHYIFPETLHKISVDNFQ